MPELIAWQADGTPFSPRFGDRYRGEAGGLEAAREVFLHGCKLPAAWAGQSRWCVLETGFGLGLNFLLAWQAWREDAARPRLLHFVSAEAYPPAPVDLLRAAAAHPTLLPLADELHTQFWGLLPGVHRLVFEGGQVLLTLLIGDARTRLREQAAAGWQADSVYLDGFSPDRNPEIWQEPTLKAVARCCRPGTRVATWTVARSVRDALAKCGFTVQKAPGAPPKRDRLEGQFEPPWPIARLARGKTPAQPRPSPLSLSLSLSRSPVALPGHCVVVGAGLAGAAVAASLARRGWQVTVLDTAAAPAAGASSLPAGVLAPHVSPDDSVLSQLSRSGVRATWQQATARLESGRDWLGCGVFERAIGASPRRAPAGWLEQGEPDGAHAAHDWLRAASSEDAVGAGLPAQAVAGLWHVRAGWAKPAALVQAWLSQPGIVFQGGKAAAGLSRVGTRWQVHDADGVALAVGDRVVLAAGPATAALLAASAPGRRLALQPIRGQVTIGQHGNSSNEQAASGAAPAFPVNGHGSFIAGVPLSQSAARIWLAGATYQRDSTSAAIDPADDAFNLGRLNELLPGVRAKDSPSGLSSWVGMRCATPNRLPAVGEVEIGDGQPVGAANDSGVWICSGLGSRGLTFAALCAELLAASWHGEPLPIAPRHARMLQPRFVDTSSSPRRPASEAENINAGIERNDPRSDAEKR